MDRMMSAMGSRGTCEESGKQWPTAMKVSACWAAVLTSLVLPIPASPVMRSRPLPASRWRRTAASSALRPAMRGAGAPLVEAGIEAATRAGGSPGCLRPSPPRAPRSFPTRAALRSRRPWRRWCARRRRRARARAARASLPGGAGRAGQSPGPGAVRLADRVVAGRSSVPQCGRRDGIRQRDVLTRVVRGSLEQSGGHGALAVVERHLGSPPAAVRRVVGAGEPVPSGGRGDPVLDRRCAVQAGELSLPPLSQGAAVRREQALAVGLG